MKTKSLFAALLLLIYATSLLASNISVDGIWYDFDNSTQTASVTYRGTMPSDYKGRYQGEVVIPASVTYSGKTYRVTSIGDDAFLQCSSLTSVTIPNSVTNIGRYAFSDCASLVSITIPNSVTGIEEGAFARCISLTSITIPNSVKNIGNYAFVTCSGLASIIVDSDNTIYDSRDNCNAIIQTGTSTLLSGCKNTIIPNSVSSIGGYAFYGCTGLTSVTIPNSVKSIKENAFNYCSGLASITIPDSIISIGNEAFAYCTGLTGITIGNDVSYIGNLAFEHCSSLTSIIWNAKNYTSEVGTSSLFYYIQSQIISFEIGNDVEVIPPYLCSYMSRLTSVTIPNSVTSIGKGAFINVPNIMYSGSAEGSPWGARCVNGYVDGWMIFSDEAKTNLVTCSRSARDNMIIPNGVISIGIGAFELCSDITSVTIPNSVTDFGNGAFSRCTGLTSVTINCSAGIGSNAFQGCSSLATLTFGNNYTIIKNNNAFSGCSNLKNILLGSSVKVIEENTFIGCKKIETITCYSMRPPTVNDGAFENLPYSTIIYVPADYLTTYKMHDFWGVFDVRPLGATSAQITDLQITPDDNTANVVWPTVENAATYEMIIKDKNGVIVCTLIFNANGQLTSIAFAAPGRSPASTQSAGFSFTVTGLEGATLYDLTMTAKDNSGNVLQTTTKSFATNGYTAIDNVESSAKFGGQKLLHNGQLFILRDGKIYTVQGQEVK